MSDSSTQSAQSDLDRQKTGMQEKGYTNASHLTLREACEIAADLGMNLDEVVIRQGRSTDWQDRALPLLVFVGASNG